MVLGGEAPNAFAAVRPPGHHAETATAMGFCIFGSVAIAAKHALDHHGLSRVAIVDFDVHHGNGTQDLLWDEARTLVITSQQMPLFPGTGTPAETGAHGNVLNLPLAPGSTGADMRAAYTGQAFPRLRSFRPELILVSAGFDAHSADPLANLEWETEDFRWITAELCALAAELCDGRVLQREGDGCQLAVLAFCSWQVQDGRVRRVQPELQRERPHVEALLQQRQRALELPAFHLLALDFQQHRALGEAVRLVD